MRVGCREEGFIVIAMAVRGAGSDIGAVGVGRAGTAASARCLRGWGFGGPSRDP